MSRAWDSPEWRERGEAIAALYAAHDSIVAAEHPVDNVQEGGHHRPYLMEEKIAAQNAETVEGLKFRLACIMAANVYLRDEVVRLRVKLGLLTGEHDDPRVTGR